MTGPAKRATPVGHVVTITRVIKARRERVFAAWTDPKQMAQWWGPDTFTNPVCELDVRPGGAYRTVMRSPTAPTTPSKVSTARSSSPS